MILERTPLPGIGACHALTTGDGQRIGVVLHHTGRRDVIVYDPDEPARAAATVALAGIEARQVAELLAGTLVVEHVAGPGTELTVCRIRVPGLDPGDELVVAGSRAAVDEVARALSNRC